MSWLSKKLGKLLLDAVNDTQKISSSIPEVARSTDPTDIALNQTQFTVIKCANGRLVKVSQFKPTKSLHSDWVHELHIVHDNEKVADVITRIMAINALEA